MSEWSGFFDAHKVGESWDRSYLAEDFAKFLSPLIGNGVFAGRSNELQVFQSVPAGMSVIISSGQSWIEGYGYINDSDLMIPIDPADGTLGRIDRIVNQWSAMDRQIRTVWKKGTPAVNPVAPPLQWDADYKELNLCTLDITAGLSAITQDIIKDTRADSSVCGWVTGLIDQVDTATLFAQWEAAYEKEFTTQKAAWEKFFEDIQADLGVPVPSPSEADNVLSVDVYGKYVLSDRYLKKDDVGNLPMGGHRVKDVAAPEEDGDAVNLGFVKNIGSVQRINKTLAAAGWVASETAGFVQSVVVDGLADEKKVRVYPAIPATLAEKLALAEETPKVKASTRTGNTMTFEAWEEAPALDIPIIVEVVT